MEQTLRVVFMGTPPLAATVLEALAQHFNVVAAYTRPDAVRGRGNKLVPSAVKETATRLGIPVLTPKTLRTQEAVDQLRALEPDVVCVAAYGAILPKEILDIPEYGCLNVHASLLPRWRGAAPIERAILAGDERAGVCIMRMEEGLDTGDFCAVRSCEIGDMNADQLTARLAELGSEALVDVLEDIQAGRPLTWTAQGEGESYAKKIDKGELDLSLAEACVTLVRKVRASDEAHPSHAVVAGKPLIVCSARVPEDDDAAVLTKTLEAGQVLFAHKRLFLGAADGAVEVMEVKPQGKKRMDAKAFAAGVQGIKNTVLNWENQ